MLCKSALRACLYRRAVADRKIAAVSQNPGILTGNDREVVHDRHASTAIDIHKTIVCSNSGRIICDVENTLGANSYTGGGFRIGVLRTRMDGTSQRHIAVADHRDRTIIGAEGRVLAYFEVS